MEYITFNIDDVPDWIQDSSEKYKMLKEKRI